MSEGVTLMYLIHTLASGPVARRGEMVSSREHLVTWMLKVFAVTPHVACGLNDSMQSFSYLLVAYLNHG